MTLYHGSPIGNIKELVPSLSEHGKPYIYFAKNPVVALLYAVRPVEKPFSWYPYGFDGDTVIYSEYYEGAFADIYKDKIGFLYECDNVPNTENPTNINCAYTCEKAVTVDRVSRIDDIYKHFMNHQSHGNFCIKEYKDIGPEEIAMVTENLKNLILNNNLIADKDSQISRFISEKFPQIWKEFI